MKKMRWAFFLAIGIIFSATICQAKLFAPEGDIALSGTNWSYNGQANPGDEYGMTDSSWYHDLSVSGLKPGKPYTVVYKFILDIPFQSLTSDTRSSLVVLINRIEHRADVNGDIKDTNEMPLNTGLLACDEEGFCPDEFIGQIEVKLMKNGKAVMQTTFPVTFTVPPVMW